MADNYLEKQYEQYEARKAAWERERKYGKKKKKTAYPHTSSTQNDTDDVLSAQEEVDSGTACIINTDNDTQTDD